MPIIGKLGTHPVDIAWDMVSYKDNDEINDFLVSLKDFLNQCFYQGISIEKITLSRNSNADSKLEHRKWAKEMNTGLQTGLEERYEKDKEFDKFFLDFCTSPLFSVSNLKIELK